MSARRARTVGRQSTRRKKAKVFLLFFTFLTEVAMGKNGLLSALFQTLLVSFNFMGQSDLASSKKKINKRDKILSSFLSLIRPLNKVLVEILLGVRTIVLSVSIPKSPRWQPISKLCHLREK